jgi:hypothetical protein
VRRVSLFRSRSQFAKKLPRLGYGKPLSLATIFRGTTHAPESSTKEEAGTMLNPTIITAALGFLAIAGLAAVDWYVWGMAAKGHLHDARLVRPLTARELAGRLLGGVAATNGEVLMVPPAITAKAVTATYNHHDRHGFKEVA